MQQQSVQRGNGTACTVAVNERNIIEKGDQHGAESIKATQLHRQAVLQLAGRIHLCAQLFQRVEGINGILGEVHSLQNGGSAHTCCDSTVGVGIHVAGFQQRQFHRLFRMQLLIGIQEIRASDHGAAAATTHQSSTPDNIDQLFFFQNSLCHVTFLRSVFWSRSALFTE